MKDQSQTPPFDLGTYMPFQLSVITARLFQNILGDAGFQVPEWRILMTLPALQRDNQGENPASIRMRTRVWGRAGRA